MRREWKEERKKWEQKEGTAPTESTQEVYFLVEQTGKQACLVGVYGGKREQRRKGEKNKISFLLESLRKAPAILRIAASKNVRERLGPAVTFFRDFFLFFFSSSDMWWACALDALRNCRNWWK